jgi:hypothetical protein
MEQIFQPIIETKIMLESNKKPPEIWGRSGVLR